ncbi:MAG: ABC transporter ATP-binding protein [Anaerolineae bacterium]|jgi:putative ABC transport system ATP-binding protein|nr:ABC transporter ATP-binding protein [Anaerolineae bacterium]MBT7072201.1 ABC transporter ATP-binding protein [Anaerolineae bacterium]MBT7324699.1 ABC transporter ATP-binding protein [Anaerolineae bacterium]
MKQKIILETKNVSKVYDSNGLVVKAVDEVNLRVKAGEFVGLVGPSGSGKTTMLAMLATLLRETGGSLLIDKQDLGSMSDAQRTKFRREKIGFTFQSNNLVPYLTALENVELMLRLNKTNGRKSRERAIDLLTRLGLEDRLHSLPSQLSGGQQQRVAIARSLIHDPSVVLADEPTASLDTERANQVVQIFADLIHEGQRAGIMVTHDLRMCKYADKIVQMVDGKISRVITERSEIDLLAGTSKFDQLPNNENVEERRWLKKRALISQNLEHLPAGV